MENLNEQKIFQYNQVNWKIPKANIQIFENTDSTHQKMLQILDKNKHLVYFYLIIAKTQYNGIGRQSNFWYDEKDKSILLSFYQKQNNVSPVISILNALSCVQELNQKRLMPLTIKWPNDLYLNHKKIAGFLTQKVKNGVVVSLGCNYALEKKQWSNWIDGEKNPMKITPLLIQIVDLIMKNFKTKKTELNQTDIKNFNQLHYLHNTKVSFQYNKKIIQGDVEGIEKDGALKIKTENQLLKVYSTNIKKIRPT